MLHQEQVLGAGQEVLSWTVPVGIHLLFDIREQNRSILDLIKDYGRRIKV
jgi:hypothetical protein